MATIVPVWGLHPKQRLIHSVWRMPDGQSVLEEQVLPEAGPTTDEYGLQGRNTAYFEILDVEDDLLGLVLDYPQRDVAASPTTLVRPLNSRYEFCTQTDPRPHEQGWQFGEGNEAAIEAYNLFGCAFLAGPSAPPVVLADIAAMWAAQTAGAAIYPYVWITGSTLENGIGDEHIDVSIKLPHSLPR